MGRLVEGRQAGSQPTSQPAKQADGVKSTTRNKRKWKSKKEREKNASKKFIPFITQTTLTLRTIW